MSFKLVVIFGVLATFFVYEASCKFIHPTYKPPPTKPPTFRFRRSDDQPLSLYGGDIPRAPSTADHPFLPKYIDDVKLDPNRRVARSLGTPSVSRGSSSARSSSSRDTGPTHPGYNRRNARSIPKRPGAAYVPPFRPSPFNPNPRPVPSPTLARH